MNYGSIYKYDYFKRCDGIRSWNSKKLKFGDALSAVCYAHGISWDQMKERFPLMGTLGKNENTPYTVQEQIEFVEQNKKRTPNKILEIGGGRGEVTCFLAKMGYDVHCIEPGDGAEKWLEETSQHIFGESLEYTLYNGCVSQFADEEGINGIDTVLMVESLEHILPKHFEPIYERCLKELKETKGRMVIVNWPDYHPIWVGRYAPKDQHCRLVDDALYNQMTQDFGEALYRNGSHICLQIKNPEEIP